MNAPKMSFPRSRLVAIFVWILLQIALVPSGYSQALQPVPPLHHRVTDLAGALTPEQAAVLEKSLKDFGDRKGSQVGVLIVKSTAPESIDQYALRVAEQWKLGRNKIDDGVLLLVALNDRAVRIEVGYGLESVLTDLSSHRIISEIIAPKLTEGDIYGAVSTGVAGILTLLDGQQLAPAHTVDSATSVPGENGLSSWVVELMVVILVTILYAALALAVHLLEAIFFGRFGVSILVGVIAASVRWDGNDLQSSGNVGVFSALAYMVASWLLSSKSRSGVSIGSGSSGGGFSGGGGRFGGGGSSGRF